MRQSWQNFVYSHTYEWWNLFWTAFAGFATFSAVFVALWQTRIANRKRLKMSFSDSIVVADADTLKNEIKYVSVTVANTGNRFIIINRLHLKLKNKSSLLFITERDELLPFMPNHVLAPEENVSINFKYYEFVNSLKENVEKNSLDISDKLVFLIQDSTGNKHLLKTKKRVRDYIKTNKKR